MALPAPCVSCRQFSFPFRRVLPPRLLRRSLHKPNGGDKRVEQARIVALAGDAAQVVVHRIRITPHVKDFDIRGRAMKGWVLVAPEGIEADDQLSDWIQRAVKFVGKLQAKEK